MKIFFAAAIILSFMTSSIAQMDPSKKLAEEFVRRSKEAGVVGGSLLVLKGGRLSAESHFGLANIGKDQQIDSDTIYHWASNTKPFTGIAIMQLRDRGLLRLDDPATKYLPELRKIYNPFGSMDEITIRHLLTHSGGFRGGTWPWRNNKSWEPFEPTEWSQLVAMFPFTEVLFEPGTKFSYSNPGIIYLGRIIEEVSGEPYEAYIDKNILRPLGMHRSYFDTTPTHLMRHRSHSYYIRDGIRTEGRFDADTGITVSNSGLNAPVSDMVKYLNFLTGVAEPASPEGVRNYDLILRRSSLEEMFQPRLSAATDANGNVGFTTDIGLIFFIDDRNGRKLIGHGGDQNGFISYIEFQPIAKTATLFVLNTNVGGKPGSDLILGLRHSLRIVFD
ncbi:serine hydrolase domain-containing protein [Leptolyngbya sp. 7M]|uniref:serine hydrolase domain-containing protein n=1 Tax=Leptolyngbya sp. 7M TaxID=2812896 RepID=UPI001B8C9DA2|nr:serine hydrolase domain-containing protein [Leptolyngbya sp. 7M]QYO66876.1 beta-lactamase family protein [Leptolyngbya sp. 7M]